MMVESGNKCEGNGTNAESSKKCEDNGANVEISHFDMVKRLGNLDCVITYKTTTPT